MSQPTPPTGAQASISLGEAERSRSAARAARPTPGWFGPVRGGLFAAFFGLLLGPWIGPPLNIWVFAAVVASGVAFLAVHAAVVRRGGVIGWPRQASLRVRILVQLIPAVAYGLGWIAAIPYGQAGGAIASALTGGGALWLVTAWQNAMSRNSQPRRSR